MFATSWSAGPSVGQPPKFPFVFFGRLRKLTRLWNWIGRQTTVIKDWFWWGGVRGLWKLLLGWLQGFFQDQNAMLQANVKLETQFNLPHRPTATHSAKVCHQDWFSVGLGFTLRSKLEVLGRVQPQLWLRFREAIGRGRWSMLVWSYSIYFQLVKLFQMFCWFLVHSVSKRGFRPS